MNTEREHKARTKSDDETESQSRQGLGCGLVVAFFGLLWIAQGVIAALGYRTPEDGGTGVPMRLIGLVVAVAGACGVVWGIRVIKEAVEQRRCPEDREQASFEDEEQQL